MLDKDEANPIQERLSKARKAKGLTQEAVGRALGKSKAHVGNLEGNQGLPPAILDLQVWAKTCGVSADYLLNLTDDPTPNAGRASEDSEQILLKYGTLSAARKQEFQRWLDLQVEMQKQAKQKGIEMGKDMLKDMQSADPDAKRQFVIRLCENLGIDPVDLGSGAE